MMKKKKSMIIIYLAGIKHSGKSSVGRHATTLLQKSRPVEFIDLDDEIKELLPSSFSSIREYYGTAGSEAFKSLELEALQTWLKHPKTALQVVALGGGACDNDRLVSLMKTTGKIIYLAVDKDVLLERILQNGIPPFLSKEDPAHSFHLLFEHRDTLYRHFSDYVLQLYPCRSIPENAKILVKTILEVVGKEESWQEIYSEPH